MLTSAALGRCVAVLLDTEKPVEGVTCGKIDPRLKDLGVIRKVGGGALDPDAGVLSGTPFRLISSTHTRPGPMP